MNRERATKRWPALYFQRLTKNPPSLPDLREESVGVVAEIGEEEAVPHPGTYAEELRVVGLATPTRVTVFGTLARTLTRRWTVTLVATCWNAWRATSWRGSRGRRTTLESFSSRSSKRASFGSSSRPGSRASSSGRARDTASGTARAPGSQPQVEPMVGDREFGARGISACNPPGGDRARPRSQGRGSRGRQYGFFRSRRTKPCLGEQFDPLAGRSWF